MSSPPLSWHSSVRVIRPYRCADADIRMPLAIHSGRTPRAFSLYPAAKLVDLALGCTRAVVAQRNDFNEPSQHVPLHLSPTYAVPVVCTTSLAASLQFSGTVRLTSSGNGRGCARRRPECISYVLNARDSHIGEAIFEPQRLV